MSKLNEGIIALADKGPLTLTKMSDPDNFILVNPEKVLYDLKMVQAGLTIDERLQLTPDGCRLLIRMTVCKPGSRTTLDVSKMVDQYQLKQGPHGVLQMAKQEMYQNLHKKALEYHWIGAD